MTISALLPLLVCKCNEASASGRTASLIRRQFLRIVQSLIYFLALHFVFNIVFVGHFSFQSSKVLKKVCHFIWFYLCCVSSFCANIEVIKTLKVWNYKYKSLRNIGGRITTCLWAIGMGSSYMRPHHLCGALCVPDKVIQSAVRVVKIINNMLQNFVMRRSQQKLVCIYQHTKQMRVI